MDRANHLWPDIARLVPKAEPALPWLYASTDTAMGAPPLYTNLQYQTLALRRCRCLTSQKPAPHLQAKLDFPSLMDMLLWAAERGRLGMIQFLKAWCPHDLTIRNGLALPWAAKNGHLHVLQHFKEQWGLDKDDIRNCLALSWSAQNGHLPVLQFLVDQLGLRPDDVSPRYAFQMAADNGHVEVMQFLKDRLGVTLKDVRAADNHVLRMAAHLGNIRVLAFLKQWRDKDGECLTPDDARDYANYALYMAAQNGHVHILKALKTEWHFTKQDLMSNNWHALITAARHGQVQVLQVCQELWPQTPADVRAWISDAALAAAANGHVSVLQFLKEFRVGHLHGTLRTPTREGEMTWSLKLQDVRARGNEALRAAARNGHVKVLQFLKEFGLWPQGSVLSSLTLQDVRTDDNYALRWAARFGHTDVVQFFAQWRDVNPDGSTSRLGADDVRRALVCAHEKVMPFMEQWLIELS